MSQTIKCTGAFHEQLMSVNTVMELFVYLTVQVITVTYSRTNINGEP